MGWLFAHVNRLFFDWLFTSHLFFLGYVNVVDFSPLDFIHTISVISMIRVDGVEERELGVLTLILANFVFKQGRVGRARHEQCRTVDNGLKIQ